ncbi:MAG: hypothetical protein AAF234_02050 [Pseudomonadota bacterium]
MLAASPANLRAERRIRLNSFPSWEKVLGAFVLLGFSAYLVTWLPVAAVIDSNEEWWLFGEGFLIFLLLVVTLMIAGRLFAESLVPNALVLRPTEVCLRRWRLFSLQSTNYNISDIQWVACRSSLEESGEGPHRQVQLLMRHLDKDIVLARGPTMVKARQVFEAFAAVEIPQK